MKKFLSLMLVTGAVALTAACANGIPECNNATLDNCNRGSAYSEERTAWGKKEVVAPAQPPVVVEEKVIVEEKVVEPEPAPAPAPVDTQVMEAAEEPSLTK